MEWDPWFEQGDWGLLQQPLQQRRTLCKEFAKQRAASKLSYIASLNRDIINHQKTSSQTSIISI